MYKERAQIIRKLTSQKLILKTMQQYQVDQNFLNTKLNKTTLGELIETKI